MERRGQGFSLIELSATLLVVGLLLSGIIKGQGLIDIGQAQRLGDDFRNIALYLNEYQGKFKSLPGDDAHASTHLNNASSCSVVAAGKCMPGNGVIDGLWNDTTPESESFMFWQHVRLAGLVSGETDISSVHYPAKNAVGGALGITNQGASPIVGLRGASIVCSDGIAGKFVKQLVVTLDDGSTSTGSMMATTAGTRSSGMPIATSAIEDGGFYLVCMGI